MEKEEMVVAYIGEKKEVCGDILELSGKYYTIMEIEYNAEDNLSFFTLVRTPRMMAYLKFLKELI